MFEEKIAKYSIEVKSMFEQIFVGQPIPLKVLTKVFAKTLTQ